MFVIGYLFFFLLALSLSVIGDIFIFFVFHYPNMCAFSDILRCHSGLISGERHNIPKSFNRCYSGSAVSNNSCRTVSSRVVTKPLFLCHPSFTC